MIKLIFIICCFLAVKQDQPVLSWNASYKLSWNDFKAKPNLNHSAVAITASGITFGFSISKTNKGMVESFTANVKAHFYPEQSWYKLNQADKHVLGHEQLHFDITELYARKLRQHISHLKISNNIRADLKRVHNNILKELSDFQDRYDNETDFSRNIEAQEQWSKDIKVALKKLSEFKSYS